ncbi:MAG: hypothetical protein HY063_03245 [Bacteroidetes bacterium]|nr:hypothetical protein [Bacteroidota bacterium]
MFPETLRKFHCCNCGKNFPEDGDQPIGTISCPFCGSNNIDNAENSIPALPSPIGGGNEGEGKKRFILKIYSGIKNFHPIYFISPEDTSEMRPLGNLSMKGIELLQSEGMLTEIPATEIIENYFRHKWLLSEIQSSKYFELKIKTN